MTLEQTWQVDDWACAAWEVDMVHGRLIKQLGRR